MKISEHQVMVILFTSLFIMCLITFIFRWDINTWNQSVITMVASAALLLNLGVYLKWRWAYSRHVAVITISLGCALYFDARFFHIAFPAGMLFAPAMALLLLKHPKWVIFIGTVQFLAVLARSGPQPGITLVSVTMYYAIMIILIIAKIISDNSLEQAELNEKKARDTAMKLEDMNQQLNKEIQQRKSLENRLVQARKMEAIGNLAGGIAHDFNNILYPIIGFTQLSMDELPKDHPVQENLTDILDGAIRAKEMVQRILLFSRQQDQTVKPTQLVPVIQETLKFLRSSIPANIQITTRLDDIHDHVLCHGTQIHEIVMNLCTNAYHALENHGGEIVVELKKDSPDDNSGMPQGEYLCLSVSDNGDGIDKSIMDKIFEPYFTTKGIEKGTGMGLSVVHGIVKSYNGEITVKSTPGQGSLFKIFLPTTDPVEEEENQALFDGPIKGGKKILFIDDEKSIVKLGVNALKRYGYEVTGMQDSMEALQLFHSDPGRFDLVVTDMAMPAMVGTELIRNIKKVRPDIPVIICSGYSDALDQGQARAIGINALIDKPILIETLAAEIGKIFDKD